MIIHWPAFLCWVTQSPSPQSLKTSTRTTSSNCISSPIFTIFDQRVNTLLRGTDAHVLNVFAAMLNHDFQKIYKKCCVAYRWMEVIRSATVPSSGTCVLNNREPLPHWVGRTVFPCAVSLRWHLPVLFPRRCFSFLHISGTFIHVSMHIWCFFFNALLVTCPLV